MDTKATTTTIMVQARDGRPAPRWRPALATLALFAGLLLQATARAGGAGGAKPVGYRGDVEALFAQDGRPTAAALEAPPGFTPRSRAGLYASAEQLAWQAWNAESYTVVIDLDGRRPADRVLTDTVRDYRWGQAHAPQAMATAYYVRAATARQAVDAADTLTTAGVPLVFVVVDTARAARPLRPAP